MKKLWVIVFLIVSGYIFSAGFLLSGIGSEAISLGGAFRAQANDYSVAYWNPAGLVQIQNPEFTLLGGPIYNYATLTLNNATGNGNELGMNLCAHYFDLTLTEALIPHTYEKFEGHHTDKLYQRLAVSLKFVSDHF